MKIKRYKIEITETLQRVIEIESNSIDDAISEIHRQYKNEEIILDSSDYIDINISEYSNQRNNS